MSNNSALNLKSAGVKRLLQEAKELHSPNELFSARPLESDIFEWHFSIKGPSETPYHGGIYHGRILLPAEYPMKPPNIMLLTPNGRFETNKKICLSISGYHPETWLPSWSIRTALLALIGFMPTHSIGAVGGLECSNEERQRLANRSLDWRCEACNMSMREVLPQLMQADSDEEELTLRQFLEREATKTHRKNVNKVENNSTFNDSAVNIASETTNEIAGTVEEQISNIDETVFYTPTTTSQPRRNLFESHIFWIFVFFLFLIALFCRRMIYF